MINADRANQVLTAEQYAAICELQPPATLKAKMSPGLLPDLCKIAGAKPSVHQHS